MKRSFLILIIMLLPVQAADETRIASLDIVAIYQQYSLVQEANQTVDEAQASFERIVQTANEEIQALQAQAGKEKEIAAKREAIQAIVDEQVEALQDKKDLYNTRINRKIAETLTEFAKKKNLDLIVEKGYLLLENVDDITEEFIQALEKNNAS